MQRRLQVRVFISGDIQKAGFRSAFHREALRWGVVGWVKNLEDGRVEAVLNSTESNINNLVGWCRAGPLRELVEDVQVSRMPPEAFLSFSVRN